MFNGIFGRYSFNCFNMFSINYWTNFNFFNYFPSVPFFNVYTYPYFPKLSIFPESPKKLSNIDTYTFTKTPIVPVTPKRTVVSPKSNPANNSSTVFKSDATKTPEKANVPKHTKTMSKEKRLNLIAKHLEFVEGKGTHTVKYDRGGKTNTGVTQGTYNMYRTKHHLPKQDVSKMTQQEYLNIIDWFWEESGASKMSNPILAFYLFSMDWGSGFGKGKKILAKSGNNPEKFEQLRIKYYDSKVQKDPTQKKFQKGWHNRVARDKKFAYSNFA